MRGSITCSAVPGAGAAPSGTPLQTLTAPRDPVTGAYAAPAAAALADGTYTARARQVDDLGHSGSSAAVTFAVRADAAPPGPGTAPPPAPPAPQSPLGQDSTAPALGGLSLTRRKLAPRAGRGTVVRYTLSEPATVKLAIKRVGGGRALATLTRSAAAGANRLRFAGRIGGKALKRGRYAMTLAATDAAGNRSAPQRVRFRVL